MTYSQKYTIVQFLEPVQNQQAFSMDTWPLHITLADVFAVESSESLLNQLTESLASENVFSVELGDNSTLGEGENSHKITLIGNSPELQSLHDKLIGFLRENGAVFSSPQFTLEGFLPHVTYQKHTKLDKGQKVTINELSLVDMYVDGNWQQRKIVQKFKLKS